MKLLFAFINARDHASLDDDDLSEQFCEAVDSVKAQRHLDIRRVERPTLDGLSTGLKDNAWDIFHLFSYTARREGVSSATALVDAYGRARFFPTRQLAQLILDEARSLKLIVLQSVHSSQSVSADPNDFVDCGFPAAICCTWLQGGFQRRFIKDLYLKLLGGASASELQGMFETGSERSGSPHFRVSSRDSASPLLSLEGSSSGPLTAVPAEPANHEDTKPMWISEHILQADVTAPATSAAPAIVKPVAQGYDTFLCHAAEDKAVVQAIAGALRSAGLSPWLSDWQIEPGNWWLAAISEGIRSSRTAVICIGEAPVSGWQQYELNIILDQSTKRAFPVIPLLLPTAPLNAELPDFLTIWQWIDLRETKPAPIDRLISAIQKARDSVVK